MALQPVPQLPGPPTLASGFAEIPLQAGNSNPDLGVRMPAEVDFAGQQQKGLALDQSYRQERQQQEQEQDQGTLKEYQRMGGDLQTPQGLQRALDELGGRISPTLYQKLSESQQKAATSAAKQVETMASAGEEKLKSFGTMMESIQKAVSPALDAYDKAAKEKGIPAAEADFQAAKMVAINQLQQLKAPDGKQPLLPPEAIKEYTDITPEALRTKIGGAKWKMDQLKEAAGIAKEQAQAKQAESTTTLNAAKTTQLEQGGALMSMLAAAEEQYGKDSPEYKAVLARMPGSRGGGAPGVDESTVTPEQRKLAVNQWVQNPSSMRGMDKTYQQRVIAWAAELGITPEDVTSGRAQQKFDMSSAGASGRRAGTMAGIEATMPGLIDEAKKASAAVDRTTFVPLNKLLQMGEGAISDPALRKFKVANQAIASEFQMVISRGGSNVTSLNEAMHLLQTADSPEAYNAALDQIKREIEINVAGSKKVREDLNPSLAKKLAAREQGQAEADAAAPTQVTSYLKEVKSDPAAIAQDVKELKEAIPSAKGDAKTLLTNRLKVVEAAQATLSSQGAAGAAGAAPAIKNLPELRQAVAAGKLKVGSKFIGPDGQEHVLKKLP